MMLYLFSLLKLHVGDGIVVVVGTAVVFVDEAVGNVVVVVVVVVAGAVVFVAEAAVVLVVCKI